MAGPDEHEDFPDVPPPEVPEEFAAAYRDAYRRALESEGSAGPAPVEEPDEPDGIAAPAPSGAHRVTEYRAATPLERLRDTRWFLPLVTAVLVLVLVLGAWLLGRALLERDTGGGGAAPPVTPTADATSASPTSTETTSEPASPKAQPYRGKVTAVDLAAVAATCTLDPGVDSAGHPVEYQAENAIDGDPASAWRCEGAARGERLVLRLPEGTEVAAVGLIPGYAKTDPVSGEDRYAENNRITRVRWTLGPGVVVTQRLDPSSDRRELQMLRVPPTATSRVVLEILAVEEGSREATAISEIDVLTPAG